MIETCEGAIQLVLCGMLTHGSFLEAFLLERNMNREMIGGFRLLVVCSMLTHVPILEVLSLERET